MEPLRHLGLTRYLRLIYHLSHHDIWPYLFGMALTMVLLTGLIIGVMIPRRYENATYGIIPLFTIFMIYLGFVGYFVHNIMLQQIQYVDYFHPDHRPIHHITL